MPSLNSRELLELYQDGHSDAATAIFDRYVARLIALARGRMGAKLRRRIDAEDVVQSAYRSFFVHAKDDAYRLAQSGDLWRLLASITLHKLYGQVEKQTAAKRDIDREETSGSTLLDVKAPDPSPAEVVAIVEQLHLIVDRLAPDQRRALTSRLQGQSIEEVGRSIGRSERTVRRLLSQVRVQIEQTLLPDQTAATVTRHPEIDPPAPLRYSDYVLDKLIGSGGMGKVFRARNKHTGQTVAIKTLHKSRQSDQRAVGQFAQEAQILAQLRHPNIVGVHGLGRFPGGGYFIVMEIIDGTDLQVRVEQGPIPLQETISIIKQVASAVQYAHDHRIVHCDLKPGNVLLNRNGHVLVTDFGFAFVIAGAARKAFSGAGGTAGYVAPETVRFQSPPTPAVDIYALGALLWKLATGKTPCEPVVLEAQDDATTRLEPICRRCLAHKPEDRYRTVSEFGRAVDLL